MNSRPSARLALAYTERWWFMAATGRQEPSEGRKRQLPCGLVTSTSPSTARPLIVVDDVVRADLPLRHDPDKLSVVLMRILKSEGQRRKGSMNGRVVAKR